jgi:glycogen synthase
MPYDMEFMDIRKGSDVEFGQSIYEPFGIAQLEPLTFGGICVFSSVCGCLGFLRDVMGPENVKNVIVADYTDLEVRSYIDVEDLLQINRTIRDRIEASQSEKVAMQICSRLPKDDSEIENMVKTGYELAKNMSWDVVVKDYLLNSIRKIPDKVSLV